MSSTLLFGLFDELGHQELVELRVGACVVADGHQSPQCIGSFLVGVLLRPELLET